MALRKILTQENEILHKVCKPVVRFDENLFTLLDDMKETLEKANGVGLAAPQVGVLKRLFVISVNNCYFEVINPRIVKTCGKQTGPEGCLSVPNKFENVTRAKTVTIEFEDRFENKMSITASDLMARAFLHESDHLDGILYVDLLKKNKSVNV